MTPKFIADTVQNATLSAELCSSLFFSKGLIEKEKVIIIDVPTEEELNNRMNDNSLENIESMDVENESEMNARSPDPPCFGYLKFLNKFTIFFFFHCLVYNNKRIAFHNLINYLIYN